jgi:hypothetical protein
VRKRIFLGILVLSAAAGWGVYVFGQGGTANGNNFAFPGSQIGVNSSGGPDLPNSVPITSHLTTGTTVTILLYNASNRTIVGANNEITLGGFISVGSRFKLTDQGQCTMTSGACSAQSLGLTYTAAPLISLTWTGTGTCTGPLKYTDTTTTVTPASFTGTDTCQVNWFAFGN